MSWKPYLQRSAYQFREKFREVTLRGPTFNDNSRGFGPILPMHTLKTQEDLGQFILGTDEDLGGRSTGILDLGPEGKGRFHGSLSTDLQAGRYKSGVIERGGYAGFRSKQRKSLFGLITWDTTYHDYLRLRVRSSGDGMRYFVNIQTDGPVRSDLFQHRLWLPTPSSPESPHDWSDVLIRFEDFALINSGLMAENQMSLMREKVRTVGISVLGPKEGRYELGVEKIDAVHLGEDGKIPEGESLKKDWQF